MLTCILLPNGLLTASQAQPAKLPAEVQEKRLPINGTQIPIDMLTEERKSRLRQRLLKMAEEPVVASDAKAGTKVGGEPIKAGKVQTEAQKHQQELKLLRMAVIENALDEKLPLEIRNASVEDVVAQIKKQSKIGYPVTVRDAQKVSLNFSLPEASVGDVLRSIATLSGCKFQVLTDSFLIAPVKAAPSQEKVHRIPLSGTRSAKDTAFALFQERLPEAVSRLDADKRFAGNLTPHQQRMLQFIMDEASKRVGETPVRLYPQVSLNGSTNSAGGYNLDVLLDSQGRRYRFSG